jgi:hypothetical protein
MEHSPHISRHPISRYLVEVSETFYQADTGEGRKWIEVEERTISLARAAAGRMGHPQHFIHRIKKAD